MNETSYLQVLHTQLLLQTICTPLYLTMFSDNALILYAWVVQIWFQELLVNFQVLCAPPPPPHLPDLKLIDPV